MALPCIRCGAALVGGRFCPACGVDQMAPSKEVDPCVGRTIGDRYEIGELIGVGGMGRVHRGLQRSLDRPVAIKFIHPHLLASETAASRFMMEARAASRLRHPNVVNIYDFGRTSPDESGELYLVMELLSGSNLASVLAREAQLPVLRTVEILRQTLLALHEAHCSGVVHRDVKPDNIFLERHHDVEIDHVKVIDFGIASVSGHNISQVGQILGTPGYMAPEHVMGEKSGPSADIYAVGVILFEMLTGRRPFEGSSATVCYKHMTAPRPSPREMAFGRDVPEELALVCVRAMAINPAYRPKDAETFAEELVRAISPRPITINPPTPQWVSQPPGADQDDPFSTRHAVADTMPSILPPSPQGGQPLSLRPLGPSPRGPMPLVGREDILSFCASLIEDPRGFGGVVLWGRSGSGKTRLLHELSPVMKKKGVIHGVLAAPPPLCEVGYSGLRRILIELMGLPSGDRIIALAQVKHADVIEGLRVIFGPSSAGSSPPSSSALGAPDASPQSTLKEATRALIWAVRRAIDRNAGSHVFLVLDDINAMDGASLAAVGELLRGDPIPSFFVVATSEKPPASQPGDRVAHAEIRGLLRVEAMAALGHILEPDELDLTNDDILPLYLEHWSAWRSERVDKPPMGLPELIVERMKRLPEDQARALQVLAVVGAGSLASLARAMKSIDALESALEPLCTAGLAWRDGSIVALSHPSFGPLALSMAPADVIAQLHASAAEVLGAAPDLVELRAYHSVRGDVGPDSFVVLEEAANLRLSRGDTDGAISMLEDAVRAARVLLMRGDEEIAGSAWAIFGRKLSSALLAAGRPNEAYGVLLETLDVAGERHVSRALVLEQLAIVAQHRGHLDDAKRRWNDALSIAELRADYALMQRFRRPIPPLPAPGPPPLFSN